MDFVSNSGFAIIIGQRMRSKVQLLTISTDVNNYVESDWKQNIHWW